MKNKKRLITFKSLFGTAIVVLLMVVVTVLILKNVNPTYNDDYFKTDDTKIVLAFTNTQGEDDKTPVKTYIVYYYSGENITGVKQFYQFKDGDTAKEVSKDINANDMDWVKDVSVNGPYIIFNLVEEQYEGTTTQEVRDNVKSIEKTEETETEEVYEDPEDISE